MHFSDALHCSSSAFQLKKEAEPPISHDQLSACWLPERISKSLRRPIIAAHSCLKKAEAEKRGPSLYTRFSLSVHGLVIAYSLQLKLSSKTNQLVTETVRQYK